MAASISPWPSAMPVAEQTQGHPGRGEKIIVVFFGLTASGKSTLGQAWARACGASYHNTDRVRKELAGLAPTVRRPDEVAGGIYSAECTDRTYGAMLARAEEDFARGYGMVVLDGSYSRRRHRDQVRAVARRIGGRGVFVFCTCSAAEVQRRLEQRAGDPEAVSDGRWEIYQHQLATFEQADAASERELITLDTEQGVEGMVNWLVAHPLLRAGGR